MEELESAAYEALYQGDVAKNILEAIKSCEYGPIPVTKNFIEFVISSSPDKASDVYRARFGKGMVDALEKAYPEYKELADCARNDLDEGKMWEALSHVFYMETRNDSDSWNKKFPNEEYKGAIEILTEKITKSEMVRKAYQLCL